MPHSPRPPLAATHSHSWLPPWLLFGAVCGVRASAATQARRTGSLSATGIPPGCPKPARRLVEVGQGYRALPRGDGQPGSTRSFGVSSRSPWEGNTPSILSAVAAPRRAAGLLLGKGTAVDIAFSSAAGLSPAGVLSMGFLHPARLSESSRQQGRTGFTHPIIFVSRWGRGCQHQRFLCSPPGDGASSPPRSLPRGRDPSRCTRSDWDHCKPLGLASYAPFLAMGSKRQSN